LLMKDIKNFHLGTAYYIIENDKGSKLKIELDYGLNRFRSNVLVRGGNLRRLKKQADIIAKDMLGRKARKNLNYKLLQLKV
jgi:hypothetical protein